MRSLKDNISISKKSIVDQILEVIITSVSMGKYPPGSRLPSEFELMEEYNVSRNSLREALKILSSMGVLEIKRGNGTYVCQQMNPSIFDKMIYSMIFDISTSEEIIELREIIDTSMIKLAAKKARDKDIVKLQNNINEMKVAIERKEYKKAASLDFEFHMGILKTNKNVFFQRISNGIYSLYFEYIESTIVEENRYASAVEHHQAMLDCIKNKDSEKIEEIVIESLGSWIKNLEKVNNG